jgi:hypothetical protein
MFDFAKPSVSRMTFGMKLADFYLANSSRLEQSFMNRLAGKYTEDQIKTIRGQISTLIRFARESAVREYVKPQLQEPALEQIELHIGGPDIPEYRASDDVGITFMRKCGFERNAYLHDVGITVFKGVRDLVRKLIKEVRIEERGV